MTEDMKRLIKDGKIVGYAWFCVSGVYYYENEMDGIGTDIPMPEFDNFDAGIKVGDDWLFEDGSFDISEYKLLKDGK